MGKEMETKDIKNKYDLQTQLMYLKSYLEKSIEVIDTIIKDLNY